MEPRKCPCGQRITPDPSCDMCDGWTNDADTGWGGFTDHYRGKHYNSEEEREDDDFDNEEEDYEDTW